MAQTIVAQEGRRPARLGPSRPTRLQICLSPDERTRLDEQARAGGFESLAAYVRARTVSAPDGAV